MTRRTLGATALLTLPLKAATPPEPLLTTDLEKLNSFADCYNLYIAKLQNGIHDLKLGAKVVNKWQSLIK